MKLAQSAVMALGTVLAAVTSPGLSSSQTTSQPARPAAQAPAAPAGDPERGKALYWKTGCYQCHSGQAQGGAQGPRLGPTPIAFTRFLAYLRAPAGEMPPYAAKVMSDQEVADVHAFLRALPPPPPLSSLPLLQP